jgi:MtN3 and saliva related transmembrane protein
METITVIGLFAAIFTTVALFPQFLKSLRTRAEPTKDKTLVAFAFLFCVGIFLWLIYGVFLKDLPMMVANTLGFSQGLIILIVQVRKLRIKP